MPDTGTLYPATSTYGIGYGYAVYGVAIYGQAEASIGSPITPDIRGTFLTPSNTLFPSNSLFPTADVGMSVASPTAAVLFPAP